MANKSHLLKVTVQPSLKTLAATLKPQMNWLQRHSLSQQEQPIKLLTDSILFRYKVEISTLYKLNSLRYQWPVCMYTKFVHSSENNLKKNENS